MASDWDPVEVAPLVPSQRVERRAPFNPMSGQRNALAPTTAKIVATTPPRASTAERVTFRDPTAEELQRHPGVSQVSSRGEFKFAPVSAQTGQGGGKLPAQDYKYIADHRKSAEETNNSAVLLDEFVHHNENVDTGGLVGLASDVPGVNKIMGAFDPKRARMSEIVDQATPGMRNGLPGAASDRDVAMFRNATVGLDKPKRTNIATRDAAKAMAKRQGDYVAFLEAFAKKNGNLLGAQERWMDYREANPVFEGEDKEGFPIIAKRTPWRLAMPDLRPNSPASAPAASNTPVTEEHWERRDGKMVRVK